MTGTIDNRKSVRQGCYVPIVCKKGTAFENSQTVDISRGGVGFISNKFIPINTKMAIEIALTPASEPVITLGKVKWIQQLPSSERYRVGIVFSEISVDSESRLSRYFRK